MLGVRNRNISSHKPYLHKASQKRVNSLEHIFVHRVIQEFMIQGGDPESRKALPGVLLGEGGPGYTIPAEFCLPYLYHWRGALAAAREADDVNPEQCSSGSQFYIVWGKKQSAAALKNAKSSLMEKGIEITPQMSNDYTMRGGTPHLDGSYTVFGEVIEGLDVVEELQKEPTDKNNRPLQDIVIKQMHVEQVSAEAKKTMKNISR